MPRYRDPTSGLVTFVGSPEMNPDLIVGKELVPEGVDTSTISSGALKTVSPTEYKSPDSVIVPSIPSASLFAPTPKEAEASELIKGARELTTRIGESEGFRVQKEQEFGLTEAQRAEDEHLTQLKQLELEAKSIPQRLQLGATGQGITAGGLASIEAGELRKVSIQANTTAALLLGAQGRVTAAQRNIDNAVRAKYGAEEAKLKAILTNIELLLKDPTLDAEQKARAEKQKAAQEKLENERKKKEADTKKILEWAVDAQKGGATAAQAKAIADIALSDKPDLAQAFALFSPFTKEPKISTDITTFQALFPGVDVTTATGQQQYLNWKAREARASRTTTTGEERDTTASQFLQSKRGTDGFVAAETYQEALRKFVSSGGTQSNFFASFPQQSYLRQEEIDKLPPSLKPTQITPTKALTTEQAALLNNAKATWDAAKQFGQATPELRAQIIQMAKDLGFDISPYF